MKKFDPENVAYYASLLAGAGRNPEFTQSETRPEDIPQNNDKKFISDETSSNTLATFPPNKL